MEVLLNGDPRTVAHNLTIENLIASLHLEGKFAVELNRHIIPRSEYPKTALRPGDNIEIVQAIGGG